MPFAIANNKTPIVTVGSVKLAVAQPNTTQRASLYGVEVSCQNGFSTDPQLDVYVFNNPLAAKAFIESLGASLSEEQESFRLGTFLDWDETTPGRYIVTAQRAAFPENRCALEPLSIPGCSYSGDPNPFVTDTEGNKYPRADSGYLTIVAVFNTPANITDDYAFIRTKTIHG